MRLLPVFAMAAAVFAANANLIEAVKRGDLAAVRVLAKSRAQLAAADADGSTALHWAVRQDAVAVARALLAAGADAKAATRYKVTPLYLAANNGNAELVDALLKAGADANEVSFEGQSALQTAAAAGNVGVVKALLAKGARVNDAEPVRGQTALMRAAAEGNAAAIEALIAAGADVKAKSKGSFTALLFAVRNGHIPAAKALLERGANVNDVAPDGTSALGMAVVNAYFELASVLLDFNANPNLPDPRASALHTIAWLREPGTDGAAGVGNTPHGPPPPTGKVDTMTLAEKLLQKGANPNVRVTWQEATFGKEGGTARNPPSIQLGRHFLSYVGATAFYVAAKNGDAPFMRLLVKYGADPKIPTKAGLTPLMAAAGMDYWEGEAPGPFAGQSEAERLDAVKLCVELGNDVNAVADFGNYPMEGTPDYTLMYYPHNLDQLVNLGVGDPRWSGVTPLFGAILSNQDSIVQYLLDKGARTDVKTKLGWTPLSMAEGVFFANAKKEYPRAAEMIRKKMAEQARK